MNKAVTRENLGYRKLLANEFDKEKRQIRRRLLAGEKRKTAAVKAARETRQHTSAFSKLPIHRCNQQSVKSSILELGRGPIRYARDRVIFCEGDPADYLILVVKGVVRTCKIYQSGERKIAAFYLPGETFGWNEESIHSVTAEAATDTLLLYINRSAVRALAARDPRVSDFIFSAIQNKLRRSQELSYLLRMDAKTRVASFLSDLWARTGQIQHLFVPMSYVDMADYLGLTAETLSRTINALQKSGQIARGSKRTLVLGSRLRMAGQLKVRVEPSLIGVIPMSEEGKSEKAQAEIQRDIFEGLKGRQPKSDQELNEWLATDEGKKATMFKVSEFSFWGDRARS